MKCPAFYDIDMNNKKGRAGGYCIVSDSAGNQAYINWSCEGDGIHCLTILIYRRHRKIRCSKWQLQLFSYHRGQLG